MTRIARILDGKGYTLRSGGAEGADTAFANGASKKEIFRPKDATPEAIKIAMEIHPAPQHCNDYVKKLHGRNVLIILGQDLITPVEFVMAWTPGGKKIGGTGLGLRLAEREDIKIYNLFDKDHLVEVHERFLNEEK
ncbi:hypothetical protein LCGC14_0762290 [marine sediment metagenome]|uniref:Uncharacterized protein n=1 Tax=marine sediment metagenome TaxID=412755 RepID=A0A0F9SKS5_9ZZZZ